MQISLEGKVALVTGASKGIGKAIAKGMVDAGASVMLSSRKQDQLEAAAAEIGGDTAVFAANAGDIDAADACVAATIERFGRLDVLVNNAATNPHYGGTLDVEPSKYDKTFDVNLRGPLYWAKAAHTRAFSEHPGVIINIASVGGMRTEYGLGVYNLTKAALIHLTRQLAHELGPNRVVGIAPGLVKTDFAAVLVENFGTSLAEALPLQRLGEPEDIANLAVFLASDQASWITGETYVIDGGAGVRGAR
ncbi:MAG: SDR family oxidoreductase [Ilumatobacter sp.]|uniref:SDR family oxidoreductase n=1 Tax=Ilumatobacter sp. TaxID=1967498 RepID=UPI0026361337|nr:SDR family oxidoreductase [Ilumatobacter sp.]MDJ0771638.1 SDR family oxidoreductase [Ilumatobacter sp.]